MNKVLEIINLIKSGNPETVNELKKYEELNDFTYLFTALVYCKDSRVFNYLYKKMNKDNDIDFDDRFLSHKFIFRYKDNINTLPLQSEFKLYQEISSALISEGSKNFSNPIFKNLVENLSTIKNNFFNNTEMSLFKMPMDQLPERMAEFLSSMILRAPDEQINHIKQYFDANENNRKQILNTLFSDFETKEIYPNFISGINDKIFTHIMDINNDVFDDVITVEEYFEKTISDCSLKGLRLLINDYTKMYDPDSETGIKYFDKLINYSYEVMKDWQEIPPAAGTKSVYADIDDSEKGNIHVHFTDNAILYISELFNRYPESMIFSKENKDFFEEYCQYAEYFGLNKTLSILHKTKIDLNMKNGIDLKNTNKPVVRI